MKQRDELFRKWYDAREGTKSESFAYDVWCAAWEAAKKPEPKQSALDMLAEKAPYKDHFTNLQPLKVCICENIQRCTIFDRCMKNDKE